MSKKILACLLSSVILASLITLSGCNNKETTTMTETSTAIDIPQNFTTFTNVVRRFSISYPADWKDATSRIAEENIVIRFVAGISKTEGQGFLVEVSVAEEPLTGNYDQYIEGFIRGCKQLYSDFQLFSQVTTTIDGREATIIDWQGTYPHYDTTHFLVMLLPLGKTCWKVSCCTTQLGEYEKWEQDFQTIVRSLRILK